MGFTYQTYPIVGGTVLIIERVQSQNYSPGAAGWAIDADGDAEFNNLVARGSFVSGDGTGKHIVIDGANGVIELWTGDPDQELPGSLAAISDFGSPAHMQTELTAPRAPGGAAPFITLVSVEGSSTEDSINLFASKVTISDALTVDTTEVWNTLPLVNGWVQFSAALTPDYRKNVDGTVQMRGVCKSGVGTIATLPVGYRPTKQVNIGLKSNNDANSYSWVQILTNGVIQVVGNVAAAQVWLTLDLSFSTL